MVLILLLLLIMFGLGVLLGYTLFGDHMAERGRYVFGKGSKPSGWLHGDTLYLPE